MYKQMCYGGPWINGYGGRWGGGALRYSALRGGYGLGCCGVGLGGYGLGAGLGGYGLYGGWGGGIGGGLGYGLGYGYGPGCGYY